MGLCSEPGREIYARFPRWNIPRLLPVDKQGRKYPTNLAIFCSVAPKIEIDKCAPYDGKIGAHLFKLASRLRNTREILSHLKRKKLGRRNMRLNFRQHLPLPGCHGSEKSNTHSLVRALIRSLDRILENKGEEMKNSQTPSENIKGIVQKPDGFRAKSRQGLMWGDGVVYGHMAKSGRPYRVAEQIFCDGSEFSGWIICETPNKMYYRGFALEL